MRRLIPPLAAVSSVVLVIVLLLVLNGPAESSGPGPALRSPAGVAQTTPAEPSSTPPSATPASRSPRPRPPVTEPPATATPLVAKAPVTVLNNSRIYHLARRAADQLSRGGWAIAAVGNFTGRIPVSTVYYAPGQQVVAQSLARQFPAVARVHPRFAGLPGSGLTLVVTREWPA